MSSHAQDEKTQSVASAGATQQDQQLAANAAKNQQFSDTARTTMFGTYDPNSNRYSGGTESAYLDPNSMNTKELTGSYANEFQNERNQVAQNTQHAVGTTMQNQASHGMGKSPAGYGANQEREAYQNQAGTLGNLYARHFDAQHGEAVNNYTNANNLLNANANQSANLSLQGNSTAAGNYSGLYGTASQQVASPWGAVLGAATGLAGAGATAYAGRGGCWIAEAIYGKDDARTFTLRHYLNGAFRKTAKGAAVMRVYLAIGKQVAWCVRRSEWLRRAFKPMFDGVLDTALGLA